MHNNATRTKVLIRSSHFRLRSVTANRPAIGTTVIVLGVVAIIIAAAAVGFLVITGQPNASNTHPSLLLSQTTTNYNSPTTQVSSTSSVSYTCHIPGAPAGAYLRILSDSTLEPVTGAFVTATHSPASCTPESTRTFTTNNTEWVSLDVTDGGHYNFTVSYSGHIYTFSAPLRPVSVTCTTLYVPSGRTNNTITVFKSTSTCP